jgi:hypothetical protein
MVIKKVVYKFLKRLVLNLLLRVVCNLKIDSEDEEKTDKPVEIMKVDKTYKMKK